MFGDRWFQFENMVMGSGPFTAMKGQAQDLLKEIGRLKDEGKLDEWANRTARGVLDAFEIMSYGPEALLLGIRSVELAFAGNVAWFSTMATKLQGISLWWLETQRDFRSLFEDDLTDIDAAIAKLEEQRAEWELNRDAATNYAQDVTAGMSSVHARFDELREKIRTASSAMDAAGDAGEDSANRTNKAWGAVADTLQGVEKEAAQLYESLYAATGLEEYAARAIDAYGQVLDADEQHWTEILGNAEDAATLRATKEQEYLSKLYGVLDDAVEADADAADERVKIAGDLADARIQYEQDVSDAVQSRLRLEESASVGAYTGLPVGPSSGFTVYHVGGRDYYNRRDAEEAKRALDAIEENTSSLVSWSAGNEQRDIERAAAEAAREQERARQEFWTDQERLYGTLLDTSTTLDDYINTLTTTSDLAPATSEASISARYIELLEQAQVGS